MCYRLEHIYTPPPRYTCTHTCICCWPPLPGTVALAAPGCVQFFPGSPGNRHCQAEVFFTKLRAHNARGAVEAMMEVSSLGSRLRGPSNHEQLREYQWGELHLQRRKGWCLGSPFPACCSRDRPLLPSVIVPLTQGICFGERIWAIPRTGPRERAAAALGVLRRVPERGGHEP